MKWTIFFVIYIILTNSVNGQKCLFMDGVEGEYAINVASGKIEKSFAPLPMDFEQLKSVSAKKSEIEVTFIDFPEHAKTAFLYAASIWENIISSSIPIHIIAKWDTLSNSIASKSRPSLNFRTFEGARIADVYYPVALVEKLLGEEANPGDPDIICTFNKNMAWYFGTNGNTPTNSYDFVTAVLHEIAHGLGFYGFLKDEDNSGFFNNASNLPSIYDYYIFNESNQQISDKSIFNSPSVELHQQLTSNRLKLYKPREISSNQEIIDWIYAPEKWEEGSSIYHFKESTSSNQLMSKELKKGKAVHYPGETVIKVLSELGWESVSFVFDGINDFETPCEKLPVKIKTVSDLPLNNSTFKLIFSTNSSEEISVQFNYNSVDNEFTGEIPLYFYQGNVHYYFEVNSTDGRVFRFPSIAPVKKLSFRVGTDYYPPEIHHNPVKFLSREASGFDMKAMVTDNIGINDVKVEIYADGLFKEVELTSELSENLFSGEVSLLNELENVTQFGYRLIAEDNSSLKNTSTDPVVGYYPVEIFESLETRNSYQNNFNYQTTDFLLCDFSISTPVGFSNGNLHSDNPYNNSNIEEEYYNHYAILKYPIIIRDGGLIKFDEIVLVEPGEQRTDYNNLYFWDYVIVEGSIDGGKTWLPVSEGYDSHIQEEWSSAFQASIINNTSIASGLGDMYKQHSINITENSEFKEGDIVIFRFRLSADNSLNGWGWAIDNLEIQQTYTSSKDLLNEENINIYPNPFNISLKIDFIGANGNKQIQIVNLLGETVYFENCNAHDSNAVKRIDLSGLEKGIYLLKIRGENLNEIVQKIIKN